MVEIGGRPILWHIMNIHRRQRVDEFIVALGYKGEVVKEYFLNFYAINNDISIDLATGKTDSRRQAAATGKSIWWTRARTRRRAAA